MQPLKEIPFQLSTIETIDRSVYNWVENLNIHTTTNKGWKKVESIWVSAERAFHTKRSRETREMNGAEILPKIVIERTSFSKELAQKGKAYGNVPHVSDEKGGASSIIISRRINQEKTRDYASVNTLKKRKQINFPKKNEKVVYETITIPMPIYVVVMYDITLITQYQQQMNDLMTPFLTKPGSIDYLLLKQDGHRFEAFVQPSFSQKNTVSNMEENERRYETTVQIKVLGYLIGDDKNQEQPKMVIRENAVDLVMPRERIMTGDKLEHTDKQSLVGSEKMSK